MIGCSVFDDKNNVAILRTLKILSGQERIVKIAKEHGMTVEFDPINPLSFSFVGGTNEAEDAAFEKISGNVSVMMN